MGCFLPESSRSHRAVVDLLRYLNEIGYAFVTPTPRTHQIVLERKSTQVVTPDLPGALGWNLPFQAGALEPRVEALLEEAKLLVGPPDQRRALVRVSRLGSQLFAHSPFPTLVNDAVFFGPDSYRFANLIAAELDCDAHARPVIVDVGTGSGVGGLTAARLCPSARIVITDINPAALELAQANAAATDIHVEAYLGDIFGGFEASVDVALANPPYIRDAKQRLYRDGGSFHGAELSIRMMGTVLPRLTSAGKFILYSGSAIVSGIDRIREEAEVAAQTYGCSLRYREIDPDVFGEELLSDVYADVERIAAVAAVFSKTD